MGKFRIEVTKEALKHIRKHYKSGHKLTIQTIEKSLLSWQKIPLLALENLKN